VFDLVTGQVAGDSQRDEREARRQGGHEDRRQAFARTADDEPAPEGLALLALKVLEVVDHHDPVPGRDPEHREEADERPKRDDPAGEPSGQDPADEREREGQERQHRQSRAPERRLQQ
jgi:hypothetical protein